MTASTTDPASFPASFPVSIHHLCVLHDIRIDGTWWHITAVYGRGWGGDLEFGVVPLEPVTSTRTRWGGSPYTNVEARWTTVPRS